MTPKRDYTDYRRDSLYYSDAVQRLLEEPIR